MGESLWDLYNDDSSLLPLFVPLTFWIAVYSACLFKRFPFHKWHLIHNFHNMGAIILGLTSMFIDDDGIFNERISILWSIAYFLVDLLDCIWRLDRDYTIHAAFCLILGYFNYATPALRSLRMNSKATLCETSSPFMHIAKRTRKPLHFLLFATVYTFCRVLWIPVMVRQLMDAGYALTNPIQLALLGFYGLNLFWYAKIIRIMVEGPKGRTAAKED